MSDYVIKVENLGKKYKIRHQQPERYVALRDVIASKATAPLRWLAAQGAKSKAESVSGNNGTAAGRHASHLTPDATASSELRSLTSDLRPLASEEFWALRGVNFEVKQGEVLGIIGRNGAGKTTLLKILSRITEPTEGRVRIRGRVASLLEIGTGFHPELTGRENIYLNGAILGMSRGEIKRKFDQIVDFSGVEKFIDTPVKRYSSGMYVRLAFAVAAHLEPEILIVDEVLAVGDFEFQKRCLGKMNEVATSGRTVLFVSHNMSALQGLCTSAIYIESGQLKGIGSVQEQVAAYLGDISMGAEQSSRTALAVGNSLRITQLEIKPNPVISGGKIEFQIEFESISVVGVTDLALHLYSVNGTLVGIIDLRNAYGAYTIFPEKTFRIGCMAQNVALVEGVYKVGLFAFTDEYRGIVNDISSFTVAPVDRTLSYIPYPALYRGILEFDYRVSVYE
jgi:lipopolysaccharide transport system ATP-binding protein